MDCLIDYIGIRNCSETPESGIYIDTLPGVSLQSIDKIATEDQVTYKQVWADVQTEAAILFELDFISEINKCYQLNAYCDYTDILCNNKARLVKAWRYLLGSVMMQFRLTSTRLNRFTTIEKGQAAELRDHYQVEYEAALIQAVKVIDVSDCCMNCGGNVQVVTWLP